MFSFVRLSQSDVRLFTNRHNYRFLFARDVGYDYVMRICAIGNSHLAAIKTGWEAIRREYPDIEVTWFGARAPHLAFLSVMDGALIPANDDLRAMISYTSGGKDAIDPHYDLYLVVGCQIGFKPLAVAMQKTEGAADVRTVLRATVAVKLIERLRAITHRPVTLLPVPFCSYALGADGYTLALKDAELAMLEPGYRDGLLDLGREHDFDVALQPARTIRDTVYTKAKFAEGGVTLQQDCGNMRNDGQHMNAKFGALYLRDVMERSFSTVSD